MYPDNKNNEKKGKMINYSFERQDRS